MQYFALSVFMHCRHLTLTSGAVMVIQLKYVNKQQKHINNETDISKLLITLQQNNNSY
jgi:hypothetical protein